MSTGMSLFDLAEFQSYPPDLIRQMKDFTKQVTQKIQNTQGPSSDPVPSNNVLGIKAYTLRNKPQAQNCPTTTNQVASFLDSKGVIYSPTNSCPSGYSFDPRAKDPTGAGLCYPPGKTPDQVSQSIPSSLASAWVACTSPGSSGTTSTYTPYPYYRRPASNLDDITGFNL